MKTIKTLFICILFAVSIQSFAQVTEKNYKIYSVKDGKEVTLTQIAEDMKDYDVLFYGEEHNDSVTHYLENKMLEELYYKYNSSVTLSMEMFERDVQTVMNEYLKDFVREKNFKKDARVWGNYKDYRPMVEFAKSSKLDVVCANAPGRYTSLASRKGQSALMQLSDDAKKFFAPLPYDTATGKYYEKLMSTMHDTSSVLDTSKTKMPPMPPGYSFIMGQSLWDATMAYSISEYLKKNPGQKVYQVNGRFHSDEKFAIVEQLKKYSPDAKVLVISSGAEDSFPNIDWNKFKHFGDYIIVTDPKVPKSYKD
jgi:uncharacterized iron-regulated protein